jgi:hypothetical protein
MGPMEKLLEDEETAGDVVIKHSDEKQGRRIGMYNFPHVPSISSAEAVVTNYFYDKTGA